jgi:hypothetical protein
MARLAQMRIARAPARDHNVAMPMKRATTAGKNARTKPSSKVLGVTGDGVNILKPKKKATNFSTSALRSAVAKARAARTARD